MQMVRSIKRVLSQTDSSPWQGQFAAMQTRRLVAELDTEIKLSPNYADANIGLGLVLTASGRLDCAIPKFEKAGPFSSYDPGVSSFHELLA